MSLTEQILAKTDNIAIIILVILCVGLIYVMREMHRDNVKDRRSAIIQLTKQNTLLEVMSQNIMDLVRNSGQ